MLTVSQVVMWCRGGVVWCGCGVGGVGVEWKAELRLGTFWRVCHIVTDVRNKNKKQTNKQTKTNTKTHMDGGGN